MVTSLSNDYRKNTINFITKNLGNGFFNNKRLLDLGCGSGYFSNYFNSIGCQVLGLDGRVSNVTNCYKTYPHLKFSVCNFEIDDIKQFGEFDIILSLSVVTHLNRDSIERHISDLFSVCKGVIILDCCVCDSDKDVFFEKCEDKFQEDLSIYGKGFFPSQSHLENLFKRIGLKYKMYNDSNLNTSYRFYNWEIKNTNTYKYDTRRLWFLSKT
jgi:cyclopropane fatty-acyl-phospholipid synthase-like methyltransferase